MTTRTNDPGGSDARAEGSALGGSRTLWWSAFFLVWTLQVLLYATVAYLQRRPTEAPLTPGESLAASAIDWYLWAAICLFCLWVARRLPLDRYRWRVLVPTFVVLALVVTLGRGVLDFGIIELLGWEQIPLSERLLITFPGRFILFFLFLALGYAVEYARQHRDREIRAAHLRAELSAAQLQMLKVQLHPHFLFNTLHAVSSLMYVDVEAADRMLVRLSELLRRTLQTMEAQTVALAEEMSFLEPYLEIEQVRLAERLRVEVRMEPEALEARVPHLILQPLVENAIRHGIAPRVEGGNLSIEARVEGERLLLSVADDGVGLGNARTAGEGVGLGNTRSRLERLYGAAASLELKERPGGGVRVEVTLPLERVAHSPAAPEPALSS